MTALTLQWPTQQVQNHLCALHPDFNVEVLHQTDSTNTQLLSRLRQGNTTPTLLVAEDQTAAKGRMGKSWSVQPGHSLTFSFLIPTQLENIGWLALVTACALISVLQKKLPHQHHTNTLKIKWPNDIWFKPAPGLQWHKLAGILIETSTANRQRYAVIGVGINISPLCAPPSSHIPYGYLQQIDPDWDVPTTFAHIAPELIQAVYNFNKEGIPHWEILFRHYDLLLGQPLRTSNGIEGIGAGVNPQGHLLIKTPCGIQPIHSGEISVRPCSDI